MGSLRWTGTDNVPGGVVSTVALAERAAQHGFCTEGRVVDVGHSTGSPARFVARRFAATVFGVDINLYETRIAREAAVREGLSRRCVGVLSAAEELPFADGSFDGAWSQDAMCHMDKRRVIAEIARILRSGAVFAFTDWIDRGGLTADEAAEIDDLLAMPELFDTATYVEVLDTCGFAIRYVEDRTAVVWGSVVAGPDESDWWEEYVARTATRRKSGDGVSAAGTSSSARDTPATSPSSPSAYSARPPMLGRKATRSVRRSSPSSTARSWMRRSCWRWSTSSAPSNSPRASR